MKQTPCECIVWYGLPVLRKELARCMINTFGLNEKEAANKLKITASAISQYISGKRGKIDICDEEIIEEIEKSAKIIIEEGDEYIIKEICRLCKICTDKNIFNEICKSCIE